jgi:hypothetical protein
MFAIPGICALIVFIYVRPQEIFEILQRLPFLYIFFALAVFGLVIDLRLRVLKPLTAPQLPWAGLFWIWCVISIAVRHPDQAQLVATEILITIILYFVIAHGVQTFRGVQVIAGTLLALVFFLAIIGIHQGFADWGCMVLDMSEPDQTGVGAPDGRGCERIDDCYGPGYEPGNEYLCERIGLLGTTSIGEGRVRYRGVLQDPNELAIAVSCALAFAFAFATRKRSRKRIALLVIAFVMVGTTVVLTKSRGGQLVFLSVIGAYVIKRVGWKGLAVAGMLALPILLLGGRGGAEADESAQLRIEAWRAGYDMLLGNPVLGVGTRMFGEHHEITAHNSYILSAAETGLVGFVLWSIVVYLSVKIPVQGLRRFSNVPGAEVARDWAMALLAAIGGMLLGVFFLSMTYHYVLWIYMGLCGAYYSAAKAHDPDFEIRFGFADLMIVIGADVLLLVFLRIYLRFKGL